MNKMLESIMRKRLPSGVLAVLLLSIAAFGLAGCDAQTGAQQPSPVVLNLPAKVRQIRALNPAAMSAVITIGRANYDLVLDDNGNWSTVVMVPAEREVSVTINWYERFNNVLLPLAQQNKSTSVGDGGGMIDFGGAYNSAGFDHDQDGYSNLDERVLGTSPLDNGDRPDAAVLALTVVLPADVALIEGGTTVFAVRDGVDVPLQAETATVYRGRVTGLQSSSNLSLQVGVNSTRYEGALIARATKTAALLNGENQVTVNQTDFSTAFDTDNDGHNNIDELKQGRNPLDIVDYHIAKTANPPIVDGMLDDSVWRGRFAASGGESAGFLDALIFSEGAGRTEDGLRSEWAAVADPENIYFAVRVIDADIFSDSGTQWWYDDSIEFFVDGDYSRLSSYDTVDDMHLSFRVGDQQVFQNQSSVAMPANLEFAISEEGFNADIAMGIFPTDYNGDVVTDRGYNLEFVVPIWQLNLDRGRPFGVNFDINDDDDGQGRESKHAWIGTPGADIGYIDPRAMGTAELGN